MAMTETISHKEETRRVREVYIIHFTLGLHQSIFISNHHSRFLLALIGVLWSDATKGKLSCYLALWTGWDTDKMRSLRVAIQRCWLWGPQPRLSDFMLTSWRAATDACWLGHVRHRVQSWMSAWHTPQSYSCVIVGIALHTAVWLTVCVCIKGIGCMSTAPLQLRVMF